MTDFGALAEALFDMFGPYWAEHQEATLDDFRDYLTDPSLNPIVRVWVDAGPGPVIQATTIAIVRQLVAATDDHGFGYAGTIEVIYAPGTAEDPTRPVIDRLLPELREADSGQLGDATVELIEWTGQQLSGVNLGCTGSADDGAASPPPNFADRVGARFFLRLAPYLSGEPHQIQVAAGSPRDLTAPWLPGAATLRQRAYYLSAPVPEPDWADYADGPYAAAAAIVELLTTSDRDGFGVLPADGISSDPATTLARPAVERMFEVITAVLASQRDADNQPDPSARGIAILSCSTFGTRAEQEQMATLFIGGYASQEENFAAQLERDEEVTEPSAREAAALDAVLKGREFRAEWLDYVDAGTRVDFVWSPDYDEVDASLDWLAADSDNVLFVQLGTLPEPLFAWCMSQAAWPPVFTRPDYASIAQNLGTAYFHLARPGSQGTQYPPTIVGYDLFGGQPYQPRLYPTATGRVVQDGANQLTTPIWAWDPEPDRNPAEQAGGLVRDYLGEDSDGPLHSYFGAVADLYRPGMTDKLSAGLAALRYVQVGRDSITERAAHGDPPVLQQLLSDLTEYTIGLRLYLAPGVFDSGGIYGFYSRFLGDDFIVNAPVVQANAGTTEIVVTGTVIFGGLPLAARIVFTAPDGIIIASGRYSCAQPWGVQQIPWISFGTPQLTLDTPDLLLPPSGAAGGTVSGTAAHIAFRLPVADGHWLLAADFDTPHLDIEDFFTVAGGVDLVRALPSPFSGLAGFGVTSAQLLYDTGTDGGDDDGGGDDNDGGSDGGSGEVVLAGFRLSTGTSCTVAGIEIDDITADVIVQRPADLAHRRTDWTVRGVFTLGTGTIQLAATGPDLVLTGALVSGQVGLADIVVAFAPGVNTADVPHLATITGFDSSFTPATGDYEVSCELDTEWPVIVGGTEYFAITGLRFTATQLSGIVAGQVSGDVLLLGTVPLTVTANYAESQWTFLATQPAGQPLDLTDLIAQFTGWEITAEYEIIDLGLSVAPEGGSWVVSGRTNGSWQVPFIQDLEVLAELRAGYSGEFFGRLEAQLTWHGADITLFYDYNDSVNSFGIVWGALAGTLTGPDPDTLDYVATLTFDDTTTVGSMIATMVSWATGSAVELEAPWSILNAVPLANLALTYTFNEDSTRDKVTFSIDVGPIELGFGRIDSISVVYDDDDERKVAVTLAGSFLWNTGTDAVGTPGTLGPWDASEPGAAPAPPGIGNKYLDVRMLALGQHVTTTGLTAATSVPKAIELMSTLEPASADTIPGVEFNPAVGWIVGADLGFVRFGPDDGDDGDRAGSGGSGYLVTTQIVFNDPLLYALRLALAGPAAKMFAGLDIQIMYRQVSDTVGVYQGEIALPDAMRHLNLGGYAITLPVFAIAVYTNGDFQVDLGFPWGGDFSRSFTVEAVVAPGIPVTGSAGLHFGKLSSASTDLVPAAQNGTFNPVLVFGVGMQIGFGKSVEYGVLKAGFSLTAAGIIEGVLATFNPYQPAIGSAGSAMQVQDGYYFWLRGTFGIAGRLYGSIDFSVVKADVDISFTLMLQITYEAYASMSITVIVAVDVSVSIRIDVGLFTIAISFSFSMRVRETLTIDNGGTPPWITTGPSAARLAAAQRRHVHLRRPSPAAIRAAGDPNKWRRLQSGGKAQLYGLIVPALTVARDENDPTKQLACQLMLSLIESVPQTSGTLAEVVGQAAVAAETSFELFAKMVLRWAISTLQADNVTPTQVDEMIVTEADLTYLLDVVLRSDNANPAPIAAGDIDNFMSNQFVVQFGQTLRSGAPSGTAATLFPIPPSLRFEIADYGDSYLGTSYQLSGYNSINDAGLASLRSYFDSLAVQVSGDQPAPAAGAAATAMSMAQWVQSDYFLLIARQMVQTALDSLRDYKFPLVSESTGAIVTKVNAGGDLSGADAITIADVFTANPAQPLRLDARLFVGAQVRVPSDGVASFETIAVTTLGSAVSATVLAQANASNENLLRTGALVRYQGQEYRVKDKDTLIGIAWAFETRFTEFLSSATDLLADPGLLVAGALMVVPLISYQAQAKSSFASIAALPAYTSAGLPFQPEVLALQNAGCPILRIGETVSYDGGKYVIGANDTLADAARALGAPSVAQFLFHNPLLGSDRLLVDVAVVTLPPFEYRAIAGDTLGGIATQLGTTVEILAMAPGNAGHQLFAVSAQTPWIDIPHLPKYQVGLLIEEGQRTLGIARLSAMVARYGMHGTRLPTDGITPMARGMWVVPSGSTGLKLPAMAGLYALTGQQIGLPDLTSSKPFIVDLTPGAFPPGWYILTGTGSRLTYTLTPSTPDGQRLTAIMNTLAKGTPDIELKYLGAAQMSDSQPASYPLTTVTDWQSPTPVALPYGKVASDATVPSMRLWTLPGALTALPDPSAPGKVAPRFAITIATYDEATGATRSTPVTSHGWASVVEFAIKRVPPVTGSPSTTTTYEISGASGADVVVLERIVDEIGADDGAFARLIVGYPPDATTSAPSGVQTGDPDVVTLGIAQSNLSTTTQPSSARPAGAATEAGGTSGLLNKESEFVRLLWEASITRSGGFYLYYFDAATGAGLPDRIFDDRGEARLRLIVIYAYPGTPAAGDRLSDYMTAVVTGDRIDTSASVVAAQAAPMEPAVSTDLQGLTLAGIAERSYSDIGDLAAANRDLPLATGAALVVSRGVYAAPPQGVTLVEFLALFPTTEDELAAANPGGLDWPLVFPTAIYLPPIDVTVGPDPGSDALDSVATLGSIAAYYGVALTRLAVDNADVADLFKLGLQITVPGGPMVAAATVPVGSAAVLARRDSPAQLPPASSSPDATFGPLFLQNTFSMLSYEILGNGFFAGSNLGLPAGPMVPPQDVSPSMDKVRLAPDSSIWEYRQSVPYSRFATGVAGQLPGLPDPAASPYLGIGSILQVTFGWQDYYGNRLRTTLDAPPDGWTGPLNDPPMLAGYTDAVMGIGQWPSVSSSWRVHGDGEPAQPSLLVTLTFDPSRYQGPITARSLDKIAVGVWFTDPVDSGSAETVGNYSLDGDVTIVSAVRETATFVRLVISPRLVNRLYLLTVSGVRGTGANPATYHGTVTFPVTEGAVGHTSSILAAAGRDLAAYTSLYYQLNDPLGVAATITSSLTGQPVDLDPGQWNALRGWLFSGSPSVFAFLSARASGDITVPPPGPHIIANPLAANQLADRQIVELTVTLEFRRTGGVVLGELASTLAVRSATTRVPAMTTASGSDPLGLTDFADDFETALSGDGYRRKVAVGINRATASAPDPGASLWAVRVGTTPGQQVISYAVSDVDRPHLFAPRPLSNELQSRQHVHIYDYTTGVGLSEDPDRKLNFADVDMDVWGRMLLGAVDELLSPEFTAAMQIVQAQREINWLQEILDAKSALATAVSKWMIPLYAEDETSAGSIQEAYYQQLLSRLSNAYDIKAGIEFTAFVAADPPLDGETPPQLFGAVRDDAAQGLQRSDITLTSPKLALAPVSPRVSAPPPAPDLASTSASDPASTTAPDPASTSAPPPGAGTPLPILMAAPDTVSVDGAVVGAVDLNLTWEPSAIEHQIAQPTGIDGYVASSWLSFVLPDDNLAGSLGTFTVPIVLRSFPTGPAVTGQTGERSDPNAADLAALTKWTFEFTWTLPFHYVQDRIKGRVEFNVAPKLPALAAPDLFAALAEFVTVYPHIRADLDTILAPIDATTTDPQAFHDANVALESFVDLLKSINSVASTPSGLALTGGARAAAATEYPFEVVEGATEDGDLLVTVIGAALPGGAPVVDISGYEAERYGPIDPERHSYVYSVGSAHLSQVDGQKIPDRTLVLPGLDVLQRQDAWASVLVTRNEQIIAGGPTLAAPFVYTTPETRFAEPLTPTIDADAVINIANVGSGGPDRTLDAHLTALFDALFAEVPDTVTHVSIQAEVTYAYQLLTAFDPIELPVFFQPPTSIVIRGSGATLPKMTENWSAVFNAWQAAQAPVPDHARLHLDLTIFSNLTTQPMPLLRLRNADLAIVDIV